MLQMKKIGDKNVNIPMMLGSGSRSSCYLISMRLARKSRYLGNRNACSMCMHVYKLCWYYVFGILLIRDSYA